MRSRLSGPTMWSMEAAFFDLDGTLLSRSATFTLARPFYKAGLVGRRIAVRGVVAQVQFLLFATDEKRLGRAKEQVLRLTKGWDVAEVEAFVREVVVERVEPFVHHPVRRLVDQHRAAGRAVYLVSSSPELVVRPLAEYFNIDGVIATRPEVVSGRYTGRLDFYCFGGSKARAVVDEAAAKGIDLSRSFAYSDSASDLPMLEVVGHPVVVDPDKELRAAAAARGWEVLEATSSTAVYATAGAAAAVVGSIWGYGYARGRFKIWRVARAVVRKQKRKAKKKKARSLISL